MVQSVWVHRIHPEAAKPKPQLRIEHLD
jgi:hypothetical protein